MSNKLNEHLIKEWHPTKNGLLKPDDVTFGSSKKVWWMCEKGHEWEAVISARSRGTGCPYCSGRKATYDNSLEMLNPILAKEWHPTKNKYIYPKEVSLSSNKKVWWMCEKGHEWEAKVCDRNIGNNCPYCSGKRVCDDNSLANLNSKLAKEWHPTKNGELTPNDVTTGSGKKVWWMCEKGHEWEATVYDRKARGGCPYCSGRRVNEDNSLANLNPELAKEWHPTKNGKLTANDVTTGSSKKVWWTCEKGHEWETTISNRSNGKGCPYCSNSTSYPDKLIYFIMCQIWGSKNVFLRHKIKLIDNFVEVDCFIKPLNIAIEYDGYFYHKDKEEKDSRKASQIVTAKYNFISIRENGLNELYVQNIKTFILDENSEQGIENIIVGILNYIKDNFDLKSVNEISIKKAVKYINTCNDIKLDVLRFYKSNNNNLNKNDYPELFNEWDNDMNKGLELSDFSGGSHTKVWWICEKGHKWKAAISNRINGKGCPYCAGQKVCDDNSLANLNPKLAKEWHPTKNGELTVNDVTAGSTKKAWWMCEKGHEWEAVISSRNRGNMCPYCAGQKVCDDNSLANLNPELAKEWHPTRNGDLTPKDVTPGSNKKVWWLCENGHEWETQINNRRNDRGCRQCCKKSDDN